MRNSRRGFTLMEFIIVIVVIGVVSAYAVMKSVSPSVLTLQSQAETMASNIRRTQTLATTWGKRMRFQVTTTGANGVYGAYCDGGPVASPCNTSKDVEVKVEKDVVLGGSTLYFNSLGQPSDNASAAISTTPSFTLSFGGSSKTICTAPLTGFVTVISSGACP